MKKEKYEAPKAVVIDFENDYVAAAASIRSLMIGG